MSIKEQIQYLGDGQDMAITINLGENINFTGYQQSIDNYTGEASLAAVNPVNDLETYRFKLSQQTALNFNFISLFNPTFPEPIINSGATLTISPPTTITGSSIACTFSNTDVTLTFTLNHSYPYNTRLYYSSYTKSQTNGVTTQEGIFVLSILFTAGSTVVNLTVGEHTLTICSPTVFESWQNSWTILNTQQFNYQQSFLGAGFSQNDIDTNSSNMQNSFFIANYYDTFNSQTQTKLFNGYLTYIDNAPISTTPHYLINPTGTGRQFYYFYMPNNYLTALTGTTATGYTQFTFYNSKTGAMQLFYNQSNSGSTTNEKLYFKTILNLTNKTFRFVNSPLNAYQVPPSDYVDRYNTSVTSMTMNQEVYPSGNSFNFLTGKYEVI